MNPADNRSLFFPGSTRGVLCLHGFTGAPVHMEYLASSLAQEGYTVSVPLLPGHGHSGDVFLRSHWSQWLQAAHDAYQDLAQRCSWLSITGLSMGGLLATLVASVRSPQKLVLCAPAFRISHPAVHLCPLVGLAATRIRRPHFTEFLTKDLLSREYDAYYWPRHTGYVLTLARKARKALRHLNSSTLLILSQKDDLIPLSVGNLLQSRLEQKKLHCIYLENSSHVLTNGTEKEVVAQNIAKFLGK